MGKETHNLDGDKFTSNAAWKKMCCLFSKMQQTNKHATVAYVVVARASRYVEHTHSQKYRNVRASCGDDDEWPKICRSFLSLSASE